jgi:hypothetical protein
MSLLSGKTQTPGEAEKLQAARRAARGGDVGARRLWIVAGLEHYGRLFMANGDAVSAEKIREAVTEAREALKTETASSKIANEPIPDHVGAAARDCGKTLLKTMPGAFVDATEAGQWAGRYLPFADAIREHDAAVKRARDADKISIAARKKFNSAVERYAVFATGENSEYRALTVLAATGRAVEK